MRTFILVILSMIVGGFIGSAIADAAMAGKTGSAIHGTVAFFCLLAYIIVVNVTDDF